MLRSLKDLIGYPIKATDGDIGKVKDFLFNDETKEVCYLVADTKGWLSTHKVLISPLQLTAPETGFYGKHFPVSLTRKDVENSPLLRNDEPVSLQYEREFARFHNLRPRRPGSSALESLVPPESPLPHAPEEVERHNRKLEAIENSHLRSVDEVIDYRIKSTDHHPVGHIEDLIIETESWTIRHFVVNLRNWLPSRSVLLDIDWLLDFRFGDSEAEVNLTRQQIKESPEFHPEQPVNRQYEKMLYDYYGRPYYW